MQRKEKTKKKRKRKRGTDQWTPPKRGGGTTRSTWKNTEDHNLQTRTELSFSGPFLLLDKLLTPAPSIAKLRLSLLDQ